MAEIIKGICGNLYGFVWGVPAMILLLGAGVFISFKTRFVQIRKFPTALKGTFGGIFSKKEQNRVTPFQAVCTALASTVGTGNIAGVAGAVALGGAGAVFWMWISAVLGMATKTVEIILSVYYRLKNQNGEHIGGPMYYIKYGLGRRWEWLAKCYAFLGIFAVFGTGNATQVDTVIGSVNEIVLSFNPDSRFANTSAFSLIISALIAFSVGFVLIGGASRIGKVCEKIVPAMAVLFVGLAMGVVFVNFGKLPAVFGMIFKGAFNPGAVTGGAVGSAFICAQKGLSRGVFSNEAGLGTSAIAHASADSSHPVKQGLFGIFEVFADTLVICTLTALVILLSGVPIAYGKTAGAELTLSGFCSVYGSRVAVLLSVSLCFFAYSTVIGWGFYGLRCFEFLFGEKTGKFYLFVFSAVAFFGAAADTGLIWELSEIANGLMILPNLIGVILLCPIAVRLIKEYFSPPNVKNIS